MNPSIRHPAMGKIAGQIVFSCLEVATSVVEGKLGIHILALDAPTILRVYGTRSVM